MDKFEADPYYSDMKLKKKQYDRISLLAEMEGIPRYCPCGAKIVKETKDAAGSDVGRRYFVCKVFQDNDLHFRRPWVQAVEEEVVCLGRTVEDQAQDKVKHDIRIEELEKEIAKLKEVVARIVG